MRMFTNVRIKVLQFLRKNAKVIFLVVCIWAVVFLVNLFLKNYKPKMDLQTTYEPHTSVMDDTKKVPQKVSNQVEEMLDTYMKYVLEGNVESAYEMLSEECKENSFENKKDAFTTYILNKGGGAKRYVIQDYSNKGNTYIYQVKYTDDFLATGLTNTTYSFTEEKIVFKKQKDGTLNMAVGSFVDYEEIHNVAENQYLKVEVQAVQKYYSYEIYTVKITNRSDDTVVIADGQEESELFLTLESKDVRSAMNVTNLVLKPGESTMQKMQFQKFYDNEDEAVSLTFGSVRVMEQYSGTENVSEEVRQAEIQNAVAKFSVNIPIKDKH